MLSQKLNLTKERRLYKINRKRGKEFCCLLQNIAHLCLIFTDILISKWHLIENQPLLREIYKDPLLLSYRKGRSLEIKLVRAKLSRSEFSYLDQWESCLACQPFVSSNVAFEELISQKVCIWSQMIADDRGSKIADRRRSQRELFPHNRGTIAYDRIADFCLHFGQRKCQNYRRFGRRGGNFA